jgi:hypothetical protein
VTPQTCQDYERRLRNERKKVCIAMRWNRGVWREQLAESTQEWVNRQLEQLQDNYRDIKSRWLKSWEDEIAEEDEFGQPPKKTKPLRIDGNEPLDPEERELFDGEDDGDGELVLKQRKVKRKGQAGDPALYMAMLATAKEIHKLTGIYPVEEQVTTVKGDPRHPLRVEHTIDRDPRVWEALGSYEDKTRYMRTGQVPPGFRLVENAAFEPVTPDEVVDQ